MMGTPEVFDAEVCGFEKNAGEELRIVRATYRGHDLIHVRIWGRGPGGAWRPTPKGLSLSPALWEAIVPEILDLVGQALEAGGHERGD